MKNLLSAVLFFTASVLSAIAQNNVLYLSTYLKENAIRVADPGQLSDSVYTLLSPYRVIMVGEMHGTNEPAQFVTSLAKLFTRKGDSVSVGLEIPSEQMASFTSSHTDSSIYRSDFFYRPAAEDGRGSFAWAKLVSALKNNKSVQLFFYDMNNSQGKPYQRDSFMYVNIKKQILLHPGWKVITISGNAHCRISPEEQKAASFLKQDAQLMRSANICSINNYYLQGSSLGNFGRGLEEKKLGRPISEYDTTLNWHQYVLLMSPTSTYAYNGIYYTKNISVSKMVEGNFDPESTRGHLQLIFDRDQKTRAHGDSAQFMQYIDSCNLSCVEPLISLYGWPGKSLFGGRANYIVFLVIQHADSAVQEKYLPMLEQSVADSESRPVDLAYLQDRVLVRRGEKQIYGTQVILNKSGGQEFHPIADEKNVNARRAKLGLPPMEEYAKYFGIDYQLPKQ